MKSKKIKFPYSINKCSGFVRHLDEGCYLVNSNEGALIYDARSHTSLGEEFRGEKFRCAFHFDGNLFFSREGNEEGEEFLYKLTHESKKLEKLPLPPFGLSVIGVREGRAYFNSVDIDVFDVTEFESFSKLPIFEGIEPVNCSIVLADNTVVFFNSYQTIDGFTLDGKPLWSKSFSDFDYHDLPDWWIDKPKFGRFIHSYKNYVVFQASQFQAVCIDALTGEQRWNVEHCIDFQWCIADGIVYGIANGRFTSVDVESGEILLSTIIEADWIQRGVMESRPIVGVKATEKHLWCGFGQAQGVCAINRETGQIDYQEFVGLTLNSAPKIMNNQIFLNFVSGGIGLNSQPGGDYILIGDGGFIEDEEKQEFYSY